MRESGAGGVRWLEPGEIFGPAGARAAFSTRTGGVSRPPFDSLNLGLHVGDEPAAVGENRRRLRAALGLETAEPVGCRQVHGARVELVAADSRGGEPRQDADGLATVERGLPLLALAADCALLALAAPGGRGCAVLHAGWRGLVGGIVERGVALLSRAAGCRPEELCAFAGPALCEECFAVRADFAAALAAAWGAAEADRWLRRDAGGGLRFRYAPALAARLAAAGLDPQKVEMAGECTACRPERWFSHRGSGGRTGRMAMTVWIPEGC